MKVPVSFKVHPTTARAVDLLSLALGITKSEVIERAVELWVMGNQTPLHNYLAIQQAMLDKNATDARSVEQK